jgi:putative pyruvate formate lyase activating enzyme
VANFAKLWIWNHENIINKLKWYYEVSLNKKPAKYLICRRIKCEIDLKEASDKELWEYHEKLSKEFLEKFDAIKNNEAKLEDFNRYEKNFLDLKVELVKRMLRSCNFCRWNCRVDRSAGTKLGTCQLDETSRVSSYFHHRGEELPLRGTEGSGTIFFTSCNMRCAFCQNGDISTDKWNGIPVTPRMVAMMMFQLRLEGVHNINLVGGEPTIHLHTIVQAIKELENIEKMKSLDLSYILNAYADFYRYKFDKEKAFYNKEFNVPILWNSNFFMSKETMMILREIIDIYLPDFKFGNDKCAIKLSRTPWYFETVSRNHKIVYEWGDNMLIRHLVMPNHVECCTKPVLLWIKQNMPDVLVNIMYQYHPDNYCNKLSPKYDPRYEEISRYPTKEELMEAYLYAKSLGLDFEIVSFDKFISGKVEEIENLVDEIILFSRL